MSDYLNTIESVLIGDRGVSGDATWMYARNINEQKNIVNM